MFTGHVPLLNAVLAGCRVWRSVRGEGAHRYLQSTGVAVRLGPGEIENMISSVMGTDLNIPHVARANQEPKPRFSRIVVRVEQGAPRLRFSSLHATRRGRVTKCPLDAAIAPCRRRIGKHLRDTGQISTRARAVSGAELPPGS